MNTIVKATIWSIYVTFFLALWGKNLKRNKGGEWKEVKLSGVLSG